MDTLTFSRIKRSIFDFYRNDLVLLLTEEKKHPNSQVLIDLFRPLSQRNQRLQELLQCPVCLTPYIEPRLLPYGHTYWDQCLNRLIQNDNDVVT